MASPTLYTLSYDFTSFQQASPTSPLPADKIEIELQNVATTTSEIITNLDLIQKTDGTLTNGIVTTEALSSNVLALLTSGYTIEGDWVTSTSYALNDLVTINNASYICIVAHTSGTFATDLSSGNWFLIATNGGVTATVTDIGNITPTDSVLLVGNGSTWVAESGSTLRTSLGLGSGDTPQFTGLNIGSVSDTTLTRVSAGVVAVEGSNVLLASNIGVSVQAYDDALASISGLSTSADKMIYATSANTYAVTSLTAAARSFLDDASVSAQRTTLDVYSTAQVDTVINDAISGIQSTLATPITLTDQTDVPYSSLIGAIKIHVYGYNVSTNGSSSMILQIGDTDGIEITGYVANVSSDSGSSDSSTAGFQLTYDASPGDVHQIVYTLHLVNSSTNTWMIEGGYSDTSSTFTGECIGYKSLSGPITQLNITTENGTDEFDAGVFNIRYE